ncbi:hypothetical protein MKEN_01391900 [Mycena kentingensis (nom. inval.)]|nr:hypothetical protein MKEN_01391900 [Mycena kentingensis (nom. inval.)]
MDVQRPSRRRRNQWELQAASFGQSTWQASVAAPVVSPETISAPPPPPPAPATFQGHISVLRELVHPSGSSSLVPHEPTPRVPRPSYPGESSFCTTDVAVPHGPSQASGSPPPSPPQSQHPELQFAPIITPDVVHAHDAMPAVNFPHDSDAGGSVRETSPASLNPFRSPSKRSSPALTRSQKLSACLDCLQEYSISPAELLEEILDPRVGLYDFYRSALFRGDNTRLSVILGRIWEDSRGRIKLASCLTSIVAELAADTIAAEMKALHKHRSMKSVSEVTPQFIAKFELERDAQMTPFLQLMLQTAATGKHSATNKIKKPEKVCLIITHQLLYQASNRCLGFQAMNGMFLWATGSARATIDALHHSSYSVSYDSVLNLLEYTADACVQDAVDAAADEHGFSYDNVNVSTSDHVEQRAGATPAKVQSGTVGFVYKLYNAKREHMLLAPLMARFRQTPGLHLEKDLSSSLSDLRCIQNQQLGHVVQILAKYVPALERTSRDTSLCIQPQRPLPSDHRTKFFPTRASTTAEGSVKGNLEYQEEVYTQQLKRSLQSLCILAIPCYGDQLTLSHIRSGKATRARDVTPWSRREVFQLGFGPFHLCLNLVWAVLHTHRGSINTPGSLAFFFALLEKKRLGGEQPDYHALLSALDQILDGIVLAAWESECGFESLKEFAASKPTAQTLHSMALRILRTHATPLDSPPPSDASGDAQMDLRDEKRTLCTEWNAMKRAGWCYAKQNT